MTVKVFLDTNLWIYLYTQNTLDKSQIIENLLRQHRYNIYLSTQTLGEMFHVLVRKKLTSTAEATIIINRLIQEFLVLVIETNTVTKAIEINNRYGYSYWDSLILATALLNDCSIIYSEDMQHNQIIEQNTKIINPFA